MAKLSLPSIRSGVDKKKWISRNLLIWSCVFAFYGGQATAFPISPEHAEARELVEAKKWSEAVVVFRGLLKKNYRSMSLAIELADALIQAHRREEALALLQTYWDPADESVSTRKKGKSSTPSLSPTQELLQSKIQILSTVFLTQSTFQFYQDALALIQQQKWKLAMDKLIKAQNLEPDNTLILTRMGQGYIELSDFDSAAEKLRLAKKLNPLHPDILLWLGRALFFKGELDAAQAELESAYRMDSHNERIVLWLFELLNSKSLSLQKQSKNSVISRLDAPEAVELIENFVKENPTQMSARLISFRNRLMRDDGDRVQLHALRNEMLKGEAILTVYFQPRSPHSPEFKSPYYLDHHPSIEQMRSELQLLIKDVELKISRLEKRGV